jgi:hypothetical protein
MLNAKRYRRFRKLLGAEVGKLILFCMGTGLVMALVLLLLVVLQP